MSETTARETISRKAGANYAEWIEKHFNSIRPFGKKYDLPLRDIFVKVNIFETITAQQEISPDALQKTFDYDRKGFGITRKTAGGIEAVSRNPKLIVLGKPGAGKTTFLKYLTLRTIDGKLTGNRTPIFIGLKEWGDSQKTLLDFIVQQLEVCQFPEPKPYIEHLLKKGIFLLLLDGFDEVSGNVEEAVKEIQALAENYGENQFVLSCRIAAWNYAFEKFISVEMADFDDEQIKTFINNWFGEEHTTANNVGIN